MLDVNNDDGAVRRPEGGARRCTSPSTARRSWTPAQFGLGEVNYQPFPDGYVGYNPELDDIYAYDPDKAKQLLTEAGYPSRSR